MDLAELDRMLIATLDDQRLTRGERQALSQVLGDHEPAPQQLALYRSRAFEIARRHIGRREDVIVWLEEIVKLLTPAGPARAVESNAYFTPGDDCPARIIDLLRQARTTVDICVFTITYDQIASAILQTHNRGVAVRIVTDEGKALDEGSDIERLARSGVNIRLERSEFHMHHKFAIFDGQTLLNGSYNWTRGASVNNQENIVVTNDPALVKRFAREFERLWAEFAG